MIDNTIVYAQIQLKKDEVVRAASALVKDHDSDVIRGMTEVSSRLLNELNTKLHQLDQLQNKVQ